MNNMDPDTIPENLTNIMETRKRRILEQEKSLTKPSYLKLGGGFRDFFLSPPKLGFR